ncbi:MAG: nuclear transport factor 2 family protein [Saprospiraceae bacterium]
MKKLFIICIAFAVIGRLSAQSKDAEILKVWNHIYEAFNSGETEKGFTYYSANAWEISPDGNIYKSKSEIRTSWDTFMKMMDEKPKFTPSNPEVKFITPDVALITWQTEDEMKMQGQTMKSKNNGLAILKKTGGKWLVEADALIPIMEMPMMEAKK